MKKREGSKISITTTKKQKSESKENQPHLPKDIVRLIMEKIPWKERLRLSLVCKSWKELLDEIHDAEEFLPWVMCFDWDKKSDGGTCKLCDPSTKTSYILKEPTERELFVGAILLDSRCGWLLFSKLLLCDFPLLCVLYSHFFLYNPFTNEIIKLPKIEMNSTTTARISLNSGLPHCMAVVLTPLTRNSLIKICHPGDESWKIFEVGDNMCDDRNCRLLDLVYTGEAIYILFSGGRLIALDMKQQQWKLLSQQLPEEVNYFNFHRMIVTFSGDLIILKYSLCRDDDPLFYWRLWRFDLSGNKWVVAGHEIMEKQVMFIGPHMFSSRYISPFSVPALGNARASAGKIFYFAECENDDYGWIKDDNGDVRKLWIQPPFPNPLRVSNFLQNKI